jgi:hypothetical protein
MFNQSMKQKEDFVKFMNATGAKLFQHKGKGQETLPDVEDDVTPGLSILYRGSDQDALRSPGEKIQNMVHTPSVEFFEDDCKDQENIAHSDTNQDEIKGHIN